jgi:hypothetical protein
VVDPQAGQERAVRQPTPAAHRRRGEEAAARLVPDRAQPFGTGVEQRADLRRVQRVFDRVAPVALDERQHHVLAAQRGQELVAGRVAERVVREFPREHLLVAQVHTDLDGAAVQAASGGR